MNKQLQSLVQKEMTRKEFMATMGFGAATVMGFGSILKLLKPDASSKASSNQRPVVQGYGSSSYGG